MDPQIALKVLHALRTIAAHSLGETDSDTGILATANVWFRQHTRQTIPMTEAQWAECHRQVVILGNGMLKGIGDFLSAIELDPEMDDMRESLRHTLAGLTRIEVETITAEVLAQHNRRDLSPGQVCDRNFSQWSRSLNVKSARVDLVREIRVLIESSLSQLPPPSVITATEIMVALNVPAGPFVRLLTRQRDTLIESGITNREVLIAELSKHLQTIMLTPPLTAPS
ncbi:MAG: hypothetical protein P4N59_08445 [Negativicutes bacterium]|nr:hypothetical protein [Negativicutes bacterium]